MFTRLYIAEYKFNNMKDVDTVFYYSSSGVIMSWSGRVSVLLVIGGSGPGKWTRGLLCVQQIFPAHFSVAIL